jgi:hypothetical protein
MLMSNTGARSIYSSGAGSAALLSEVLVVSVCHLQRFQYYDLLHPCLLFVEMLSVSVTYVDVLDVGACPRASQCLLRVVRAQ